jgi:LmbE family N-acetylglucosaminyl deacetylase
MTWNPWGHYDRNPDHRKVARAAGEAAWMAGLSNVHPEHLALGLAPHRVPHVYYAQRHDYGRGHVPNVAIQVGPDQVRRAEAAYHAHKNVRANDPPDFMHKALREIGARHGVEFAEEFHHRDEWAHLPGLGDYLRTEVRTR